MDIKINPHTTEQMKRRGTNEDEIKEVLETKDEIDAKYGRKKKTKIFPFNNYWCGKYYQEKKVEVIFTQESDQIITVTVYVYYGEWL